MKRIVAVGKIKPMAIYGRPCSPVASSGTKRLRAHLAIMLDRRAASNRDCDLALHLAGRCTDPKAH
eukprot:15123262-Alexandrium_andersonii.AAC.1